MKQEPTGTKKKQRSVAKVSVHDGEELDGVKWYAQVKEEDSKREDSGYDEAD